MSKRMKVLVAVLAAVLVLTIGGTAVVMAQEEEPPPTPETEARGLLARVADILGVVTEEQLADAFEQAQQEMRQEAFLRFLEKAVEEERITQEEADEIREWWEQRPDTADQFLLRSRVRNTIRDRQMQQQGALPMFGPMGEGTKGPTGWCPTGGGPKVSREWQRIGPPWLAE